MEKAMEDIRKKLKEHPEIMRIFEHCCKNTLEKTAKTLADGTTYVITGDIPAMWLRDSVCQFRPYLYFAKGNKEIAEQIEGLIERLFQYINIDPYANAFNEEPNGNCYSRDETGGETNPYVWERKFEVDSLCYPVQLAWLYWKQTGSVKSFNHTFIKGVRNILKVFEIEINHEENSTYRFHRPNTYFYDTLSRKGKGALVKGGTGMIWSGFRPSDDACTYGYLIPSNMFAVVILGYLKEIFSDIIIDKKLYNEICIIEERVYHGIETYGITKTEEFGKVYAYETDGYNQYNLMDDANVPSLLAMNYMGYIGKDEKVAENTRRMILSEANPYYFTGTKAAGIGSRHTPSRYIWHISLAMEGLTSKEQEVKLLYLKKLADTDGGCGCMHEGFFADDPSRYTRDWFSWADAMFCELVLNYCGYELKR